MNEIVNAPSAGSAANAVGAVGTVEGVTTTGALGTPSPLAFTPRRRIEYWVPLVSPAIATGETAVGGTTAFHVAPSSRLYL